MLLKRTIIAYFSLFLAYSASYAQNTLTLYSNRESGLLKATIDSFTTHTGIKVQSLFINNGLLERLEAEGKQSPADLLFLNDVALLEQAKAKELTQAYAKNLALTSSPSLIDPGQQWIAITKRSRLIYASKDRVKEEAITYEDLADPRFKGRICIRSGQHPYNLSLFAAAINHFGEENALKWLEGLKANLVKKPSGGDRDVAREIAAGACDLGLGNSYYYGLMSEDDKQKEWAASLKIIQPTFKKGGTHINIAGVALTQNAPNKDLAERFIAYLLSAKGQEIIARNNFEYPVIEKVALAPMVEALGKVKDDILPLKLIAKGRKQASELVEKVGFDR